MRTPDEQTRKEAIRALINIAVIEAAVLGAVVAVYFYTSNLTYLVGGLVGSMLIFGPMFLRWAKNHGAALQSSDTNDEDRHGG